MSGSTSEHRQLTAATLVTTLGRPRAEGEAAGTPETLLRISVGIEDIDDLWYDLEQALDR